MIIVWFIIVIVLSMSLGIFLGVAFRYLKYDGIITMEETDKGLRYSLIVTDDPELLANQKDARFKIIPPSYENSRQ